MKFYCADRFGHGEGSIECEYLTRDGKVLRGEGYKGRINSLEGGVESLKREGSGSLGEKRVCHVERKCYLRLLH